MGRTGWRQTISVRRIRSAGRRRDDEVEVAGSFWMRWSISGDRRRSTWCYSRRERWLMSWLTRLARRPARRRQRMPVLSLNAPEGRVTQSHWVMRLRPRWIGAPGRCNASPLARQPGGMRRGFFLTVCRSAESYRLSKPEWLTEIERVERAGAPFAGGGAGAGLSGRGREGPMQEALRRLRKAWRGSGLQPSASDEWRL